LVFIVKPPKDKQYIKWWDKPAKAKTGFSPKKKRVLYKNFIQTRLSK
jgi:hypothetical protein